MAHSVAINISQFTSVIDTAGHPLNLHYEQLETRYDPIYRAVWCKMLSKPAPVFSFNLLKNIRSMQDKIAEFCFKYPKQSPKYIIWTSDNAKVFSLGLDLKHIHQLILNKDSANLDRYIQLCIDVFYINLIKLDISPLITISLIRGKTYGGGFEAALSSDIIIAEDNARCCFPEIRYNLLPSLGTLKMLIRRCPPSIIQHSLFEGKVIDLSHLSHMGMIEAIAEQGSGEKVVKDKIKKLHNRHKVYAELYTAKTRNLMISYEELEEFRIAWVKAALHLKPSALKKLEKLSNVQTNIIK